MLGKIIFTAAVIGAVVAFLRFRQRRSQEVARAEPRVVNPSAASKRMPIGWLASGAVVVMLIASGVLLYNYWKDANELIYVRVVDASSGNAIQYQVYRGDLEERAFLTVDGVRITLAATERLETSTQPPRN